MHNGGKLSEAADHVAYINKAEISPPTPALLNDIVRTFTDDVTVSTYDIFRYLTIYIRKYYAENSWIIPGQHQRLLNGVTAYNCGVDRQHQVKFYDAIEQGGRAHNDDVVKHAFNCLHHFTGVNERVKDDATGDITKCSHAALQPDEERGKQAIAVGSPCHSKLKEIVMQRLFQIDLTHWLVTVELASARLNILWTVFTV
ncbi:unnamed protein product [Cylicocyclus nassatus]|uniref:Uncharacterized protein n=1 Tax=Cylicocyclus nassatus TaxID=53992 RepID=A0AA36M5V8_CYLNA|nr:unnamed protein product [Cylicocyclus nassatus]